MKREPNPYAQQRTYTVTQTMAISVPSVVVEDVLDGEDGGMNAADSAVLYELQSDMVELKSDVATLETDVTGLTLQLSAVNNDVSGLDHDVTDLIYNTIPTINTVVAETRAQANSAYNLASQKSQVAWLTTTDGTTSKLQITSGSGLKALQLTTEGNTATVFDLVRDSLSSTSAGSSDVTLSDYLERLDFKGDYDNKVISIRGNFNGNSSTDLYYYALAAGAFASVENPACQLKVGNTGLLYTTTDGGNVWTAVGSSDSTSENYVKVSDASSLSEVVVRKENDSLAIMARMPENSNLAYYALAAPSFYCGNGREFEFRIVDAGSNVPGLQMRSGSGDWVTITGDNNSSSGSTSNTVIFGPFESASYVLSLALNTERADMYSAIVDLRDTTNSYPGIAALSAYLAAPFDSSYHSGVLMAVSDMGALVFKNMGDTVIYDLSKLDAINQETLAAEFTDTAQSKARLRIDGNAGTMQLYSGTLNNSTTSLARYGLISELAGIDDPRMRLCVQTADSKPRLMLSSDGGNTWSNALHISNNTYALINDTGSHSITLHGDAPGLYLNTPEGSMYISNMVWLSNNASKLAALLDS